MHLSRFSLSNECDVSFTRRGKGMKPEHFRVGSIPPGEVVSFERFHVWVLHNAKDKPVRRQFILLEGEQKSITGLGGVFSQNVRVACRMGDQVLYEAI